MAVPLHITRIINASVMIEIGDSAVLTDPYFVNSWYMGIDEPVGMAMEELPVLPAIIGGHSVPDHWQMRALDAYPHKARTPVFVATRSMVRKARAVGFEPVEQLQWEEQRLLDSGLSLQAARILGADTLVTIHDAHRSIPLLVDVRDGSE